jgi:hypothetical protein
MVSDIFISSLKAFWRPCHSVALVWRHRPRDQSDCCYDTLIGLPEEFFRSLRIFFWGTGKKTAGSTRGSNAPGGGAN